MTIMIDNPNGDGQIEVFTPEEVAAQVAAKDTELAEAKTAAETTAAELAKLQTIHASQADNFKKFKDMTEEERGKFSAEQIETMKRVEAAEEVAANAMATLKAKEDADNAAKADALVNRYAGKDEALRKTFKEKFDFLVSVPDLEDRARAAAALSGISPSSSQAYNPQNVSFSGEAPGYSASNQGGNSAKEEFFKSEKGMKGLEMMGYDKQGKLTDLDNLPK